MSGEQQRPPQAPFGWLRMYAVVLEFLGIIAVVGYAGHWLDQRRGWAPWGLLGGLLLGTAAGVYRLLREAKKLGL